MFRPSNYRMSGRRGLTLIELVIVVLVIGILAAVAAPKMLNTTAKAKANGTRQSLTVLRSAIELYKAEYGVNPGNDGQESTFKANLKPYFQGPFPETQVGNIGSSVRMTNATGDLTHEGTQAWAYNYSTGQIIVNHDGYDQW